MVARHAPEYRPGMDRNRGPAWTGIRKLLKLIAALVLLLTR